MQMRSLNTNDRQGGSGRLIWGSLATSGESESYWNELLMFDTQ